MVGADGRLVATDPAPAAARRLGLPSSGLIRFHTPCTCLWTSGYCVWTGLALLVGPPASPAKRARCGGSAWDFEMARPRNALDLLLHLIAAPWPSKPLCLRYCRARCSCRWALTRAPWYLRTLASKLRWCSSRSRSRSSSSSWRRPMPPWRQLRRRRPGRRQAALATLLQRARRSARSSSRTPTALQRSASSSRSRAAAAIRVGGREM